MSGNALPEELEPYRDLIVNTGGNSVEDLLGRLEAEPNLSRTNLPVFVLAVAVRSQVGLLSRLQAEGKLGPSVPALDTVEVGEGRPVNLTTMGGQPVTGLLFPGVDKVHDISDGYHTFGEVYDHRRALTVALAQALEMHPRLTCGAWKSKRHHPDDSPMFEGYFIVGLELPSYERRTVTYHYKLEHWDEFEGIPVLEHALKWDGAPPADSIRRLLNAGLL